MIQRLYSGIQCSSCGVRFRVADTEKYREHLDWHFRQNKREKEEVKVKKFRRWYYGMIVSICCVVATRNFTSVKFCHMKRIKWL